MIEYKTLKITEDTSRIILQPDTTFNDIKAALFKGAQDEGIYIEVKEEQISSGGIFHKQIYPCLVISHPEHKTGYYEFCIMFTTDSTRTFIELFKKGYSDLEYKLQRQGRLGQLLHGNQYEIAYRSELSYYQTIKRIWDSLHQ